MALADAVETRHRADVIAGKAASPVEAWPAMPPAREDDPGLPEPRPAMLKVSLRRNKTATTLQVHASSWADAGRVMGSALASADVPGDWLTLEGMYASIGITFNQAVDTAFRALGRRHARRLQLTGVDMPVGLVESPGTMVRVRRVDGHPRFHPDDVRPALTALGYLKPEGAGWVERKGVAAHFRVNDRENPAFAGFWASVQAVRDGGPPLVVGGREVRVSTAADAFRTSLRAEDLDRVAAALGFVTGERGADWLDKTSTAKALGSHMLHRGFLTAWDDLLRRAGGGTLADGVGFERRLSRQPHAVVRPRRVAPRTSGTRSPAGGPARARELGKGPAWVDAGRVPAPPTGWTTRGAPSSTRSGGGSRRPPAAGTGRGPHGRAVPGCGPRRRPGDPALVHPDDVGMVAAHVGMSPPLAPSEAADWLRSTVAAVRMGVDQDGAERLAALWDDAAADRAHGLVPELEAMGARVRYDVRGGRADGPRAQGRHRSAVGPPQRRPAPRCFPFPLTGPQRVRRTGAQPNRVDRSCTSPDPEGSAFDASRRPLAASDSHHGSIHGPPGRLPVCPRLGPPVRPWRPPGRSFGRGSQSPRPAGGH